MPGFTRQDQRVLAALVGNHRRKIRQTDIQELPNLLQEKVKRLILLLRFSTLLHRARRDDLAPEF
ncbi:hypothetical protein RZS08_56455, partial [Arthrospira platensis SPKY1]|nr:hypothetical protein [Arthrospira platensis SPKY1]